MADPTIQGLLSNPAFMAGLGLLGNNGQWNGAIQGLAAAQGYKLSEERMRLQKEQEEREKKLFEIQMKAAQDAQARQEWTQGVLGSMSQLRPGVDAKGNPVDYQAMYQQDPTFQTGLRQKAVAFGDHAALEAGGLLQPLQGPLDRASLLAHFTPPSVAAYEASPNKDIRLLQRNPPQATPPQPMTSRDLVPYYTPESIAAWEKTRDMTTLKPIGPKPTVDSQQKERDAIVKLAQTQNIAQQLADVLRSPNFSGAVGLLDQFTAPLGAAGVRLNPLDWGNASPEGLANREANRSIKTLVTETIKTLGANPSDRDMQALYETMPETSDSQDVWYRWYNNEFVPAVNARAWGVTGKPLLQPLDFATPIDRNASPPARGVVQRDGWDAVEVK